MAGELVPVRAPGGELVAPPTPTRRRGGYPYGDFLRGLREYVAPPPPGELGWQAAAGAGMTMGAAGLLAFLPAGHSIATSGLFRWVGRSGLASTLDSASGLVAPLAWFAMVVLLAIAVIYGLRWGAAPALMFLTAQTWLGVVTLGLAVIAWLYLLLMLVLNLGIWAAVIVGLGVLAVVALWFLGLLLAS